MRKNSFLIIFLLCSNFLLAKDFFTETYLEKVQQQYGVFAKKRFQYLDILITTNREQDELIKLQKVNDFFNRVRYDLDINVWGQDDYWATRKEFLGVDRGDCEDYAISKFFTLIDMGIDGSKLFITYVKAINYNTAHMVLVYYPTPKSEPYVLDNINLKIFKASQRTDLIPVYSFNVRDLFMSKQIGTGNITPLSIQKNKKWESFLNKLEDEK